MSRIRILSEHLANQIAAGEVVERPASVIKELLENSIDAGATTIDVQVEGGGVRLMRVADDGCGMDGDDVLLCIERHATSKLRDESQLSAIATLGFRGEALPSIGSVSRMTILSRLQGSESGTMADLRYGTLHAVRETGCSLGTIIEVRHLFGNVPARKKFLKSARTESYHIEEAVKNQAIAMPSVGFTLKFDNRTALDLPAGNDLETRVRQVFAYSGPMLSLEHLGAQEAETLQVGGYLLLPEAMSARAAKLRVLVNGRAVQDKMIRHAVSEGMRGFLMKGYQPAGAILLTIDPSLVDVNVHPSKREIRFRKSVEVHRIVTAVVSRAMERYQEESRSRLFRVESETKSDADTDQVAQVPQPESREPEISYPADEPEILPLPKKSLGSVPRTTVDRAATAGDVGSFKPETPKIEPVPAVRPPVVEKEMQPAEDFSELKLIGQLFSLYLLCEQDERLVVIDQHAAHERILYGRLRQGYLEKNIPMQQLMFPVTVELGPDHLELIEKNEDRFRELGVEVEFFGDTTWVVKSVPAAMKGMEPVEVFHEVLDAMQNSGGRSGVVAGGIDDVLAQMACKAAIKAGNRLAPEEMLSLLRQMQESDVFSHCPHGRPVIKEFSRQEIEKWFHRHGG